MKDVLTKKETFEKFQKLSGRFPAIIMDINNDNLQEAVQLALAEHYLEGYDKGKKKYKRFKGKYLLLKKENALLKNEIEKLKKDNESLQEKQIATYNRSKIIEVLDSQFKEKK